MLHLYGAPKKPPIENEEKFVCVFSEIKRMIIRITNYYILLMANCKTSLMNVPLSTIIYHKCMTKKL
jgi:hypothetical protein